MGIPSCSIYTTELIKDYGVKTIIRVGSCGALTDRLKVRDVIIAMEHAAGPYRIPNVRVEGRCVYTNNPMAGPSGASAWRR